jgi:hypothetical protein
VVRVDITPAISMPMYGYENRKCDPSAGTHDPLFAKALMLESGGGQVAIVTLNLGSIVSERLKDEVWTKLNVPVLLLAASHTIRDRLSCHMEARRSATAPARNIRPNSSARFSAAVEPDRFGSRDGRGGCVGSA